MKPPEAPIPTTPPPARRAPFVARETEWAWLLEFVDSLATGRGALVLVAGEPGIGKTRLVDELMEEARKRGILTLLGRCSEIEGAPPYLPVVDILEGVIHALPPEALWRALGDEAGELVCLVPELRRLYPDAPAPLELPPQQQRRHLFNSVRSVLERASRGRSLLLVIEDLHGADASTLLLVEHLAERLATFSVLLVGTYRDVELARSRPLDQAIRTLRRRNLAERLHLRRLPPGGVRALIAGLTGRDPPEALVHAVFDETEGNPFFVEEVVKHLLEEGVLFDAEGAWRAGVEVGEFEVPENVRLAIEARLERLSEDARRGLTAAALIGREFAFELLEVLLADEVASDRLVAALEEAEQARLITSSSAGPTAHFSFAHELIRHTLANALSLPRRQRLHQQIVEAMERLYGPSLEPYAAHLARHLYQAGASGDQDKLLHYSVLAADRSLAAAAFEDAAGHLDNALALTPEAHRRQRAALGVKLGLAMRGSGRTEDAVACLRETLAACDELGDAETAARVGWELAVTLWWMGRYEEAAQLCERVLAGIGTHGGTERGRLLAVLGAALGLAGHAAAGAARIAEAVSLAEQTEDPRLLAHVLYAKCFHHYFHLEYPKVVEAGLRGSDLLRKSGAVWQLADVLAFTAQALWWTGRWADSQRVCQELKPLASRLGHTVVEVLADRPPAYLELCRTGDVKRFEAFAYRDLELSQGGSPSSAPTSALPLSYAFLAQAAFWQGRWDEALGHLGNGMAAAGPWGVGLIRGSAFLQRCYAGDREGALSMVTEIDNELPAPGGLSNWGAWTLVLAAAEGLAVLGEKERSARLYPLVLEAIRIGGFFRCPDLRFLETVAGVAAGAGGRWDVAEGHFRRALQKAQELPHVIEAAEIRRLQAEMLLDRDGPGDRARARQLLVDAVAGYREIGMWRHEEVANGLLGRLPDRGRLAGPARPVGGRQARTALFRREGEYWTVGYQGGLFRLKDARGLRYLACLLREPGKEMHVLDLVTAVRGARTVDKALNHAPEGRPGDAGELLDAQARGAYRQRITDLAEELAEAERWDDLARAAKVRAELETLTQALAAGVGLGGRHRKAAAVSERARISVTKAIRSAIQKIGENDPSLGHTLAGAVTTGSFCSYAPHSESAPFWEL